MADKGRTNTMRLDQSQLQPGADDLKSDRMRTEKKKNNIFYFLQRCCYGPYRRKLSFLLNCGLEKNIPNFSSGDEVYIKQAGHSAWL